MSEYSKKWNEHSGTALDKLRALLNDFANPTITFFGITYRSDLGYTPTHLEKVHAVREVLACIEVEKQATRNPYLFDDIEYWIGRFKCLLDDRRVFLFEAPFPAIFTTLQEYTGIDVKFCFIPRLYEIYNSPPKSIKENSVWGMQSIAGREQYTFRRVIHSFLDTKSSIKHIQFMHFEKTESHCRVMLGFLPNSTSFLYFLEVIFLELFKENDCFIDSKEDRRHTQTDDSSAFQGTMAHNLSLNFFKVELRASQFTMLLDLLCILDPSVKDCVTVFKGVETPGLSAKIKRRYTKLMHAFECSVHTKDMNLHLVRRDVVKAEEFVDALFLKLDINKGVSLLGTFAHPGTKDSARVKASFQIPWPEDIVEHKFDA